jgi:hypothetical protein
VATATPAPSAEAGAPSRDETLMDYLFGKDPE